MSSISSKLNFFLLVLMICCLLLVAHQVRASNEVLGEVQLVAASKMERSAGVWIDGHYLGYLKELKGSKKILLLPGEHRMTVRHAGYLEFREQLWVEPGKKQFVKVKMQKNPAAEYPAVTAEVKMSVKPNRAAVFVDDQYLGHVDEFDGPGQALLLAPGTHHIRIGLPGYLSFETEISLRANQKFELRTELLEGSIKEADSRITQSGQSIAQQR